jgi:hypothetical protein
MYFVYFLQMSQYLIHQADSINNSSHLTAADGHQYDLDLGPNHQQQAATLRLRAPLPHPAHITLNPYSTQLVDNINRMMSSQQQQQLFNQHQLMQLTNTLKKKKCLGGHPGPCHHNGSRSHISFTPDAMSVRSSSDSARSEPDTETDFVPAAGEVVFRAVSPHGHVYWEIDPKRPTKLAAATTTVVVDGQQHQQQLLLLQHHNSDSDTNNDMHNMSDFSEEDGHHRGAVAAAAMLCGGSGGGDHSGRQSSSSRFSDHRPLISTHSSPGNNNNTSHLIQQQQQQLAALPDNVLAALIAQQQQQQQQHLIQFSPHRFSSLQKAQAQQLPHNFSTRTRLRPATAAGGSNRQQLRGSMETVQQDSSSSTAAIPEQVQTQVTIPDLRRIPVSVKSSEYIMAKIQSHMDQRKDGGSSSGGQRNKTLREREV